MVKCCCCLCLWPVGVWWCSDDFGCVKFMDVVVVVVDVVVVVVWCFEAL